MNIRASLPATNRSTPRLDSAMVLAALPVPAVVLNAEDRFTFANGAAEQFFRLSAGALCQLKLSDILPPDNRVFAVLGRCGADLAGWVNRANARPPAQFPRRGARRLRHGGDAGA